ncbi:MAG: hypothetical protein AB7F28_06455 [Candidatus Margulisiibacteriota bacterium]
MRKFIAFDTDKAAILYQTFFRANFLLGVLLELVAFVEAPDVDIQRVRDAAQQVASVSTQAPSDTNEISHGRISLEASRTQLVDLSSEELASQLESFGSDLESVLIRFPELIERIRSLHTPLSATDLEPPPPPPPARR